MDLFWRDTPLHVKYLISDLEQSKSPVAVLSRYISTLPSDPILAEIFKYLGYNEETDSFDREPSLLEAIQSLKTYTQDPDEESESWELSRGIKEEFLKTFYDSKLNDLSEAFDLGLTPFGPDDLSLDCMWSTPVKAKAYSVSTEESTPKQCKGLKYLTSKVKSITYTKGFFSYKEVSDELVRELEITDGFDREKEEKNILRRVYDALNVLIASEVVVKEGKKYVWQHSCSDQIEINKKEIKKIRERVQSKKGKLKESLSKIESVKELINRNAKETQTEVIRFPFMIVATEEHPENMVKIECNTEHTEFCVRFKKEIKVFEDIEVVPKLGLSVGLGDVPKDLHALLEHA